ncbi:MAG: hypothetical protein GKS02_06190 [Alphaproteobacteria bacterium]|nr:hypothetical protein [Alphaproteobacteria bacterium]
MGFSNSARLVAIASGLVLAGIFAVAVNGPAPAQEPSVTPLVGHRGLDIAAGTVTMPLHHGRMPGGEAVWFVVLDTSDAGSAKALGINWSPKLSKLDGATVREAGPGPDGELQFKVGAVDFTPERRVVPGDDDAPFPPQAAEPGSRGDENYTPLFRDSSSGHIFNAPVLAFGQEGDALDQFCDGNPDYSQVHDKVVSICPRDGSVTLSLTQGFSHGSPIVYISTESDSAGVAALEGATHAPALSEIESAIGDVAGDAVEPIFVVVNGVTGADNANRQGLVSALSDGLAPLNVVGDIPTFGDGYSPLWDSHPIAWSDQAVADGDRVLLRDGDVIADLARRGLLTGPGGHPVGAEGVIVNCPVIGHLR